MTRSANTPPGKLSNKAASTDTGSQTERGSPVESERGSAVGSVDDDDEEAPTERTLLVQSQDIGPRTSSGGKSQSARGPLQNRQKWLSLEQSTWTVDKGKDTAHWWVVVISVFADVTPRHVLVLNHPAGGILPSLAVLFLSMVLSIYTANLLGWAMAITGSDTLAELWETSVGSRTKWIPSLIITLACFTGPIGLATYYSHLLSHVWPNSAWIFAEPWVTWALVIGIFPLTVLVTLKDISHMRVSSMIAGICSIFAAGVIVIRYADGAYETSGRFATGEKKAESVLIDFHGNFREMELSVFAIQMVAFMTHFNAAKYYREMKAQSQNRQRDYTFAMATAMVGGFFVIALSMIFFHLTFGHATPNITLDHYHETDELANMARIALSIGLLGCFPLQFSAMRENLIEFLTGIFPWKQEAFNTTVFQNTMSLTLLCVITMIAAFSPMNSRFIVNLNRVTFGGFIVYILPALVLMGGSRKFLSASAISTGLYGRALAVACVGGLVSAAGLALIPMERWR